MTTEIPSAIATRQGSMNERATAREIGISPTTLIKVKRGELLDYKSMKKVCAWLGIEIPLPLPIMFSSDPPQKTSSDMASHIIKANEIFNRKINSVGRS
jgi:DNA-binding Xre family transcriptional regulator